MMNIRIIRSLLLLCSLCTCGIAHSQNPKAELLRQDMSCLFTSISMIGTLGNDYSRIDIRFDEALKESNNQYRVKGKSRTRMSIICPFEGEVSIDSVSYQPWEKGECTDVDGFVYGHYQLTEVGDSRYSGTFSGTFKQAYRLMDGHVDKGYNTIVVLRMNLSEYIGSWTSSKGITKPCVCADEVLPNVPSDFCRFNDAGEWEVSPTYRKNGWEQDLNIRTF